MKKLILTLSIATFAMMAKAQTPYNLTGFAYLQNFNSLDSTTALTAINTTTMPGWALWEQGSAADNLYQGTPSTANQGNTYAYGAAGAVDRSLGGLSSSACKPHYGVAFKNNTTSTITSLNISFYGEQWRLGQANKATPDSLVFEYSTVATGINDSVSAWLTANNMLFTSPIFNNATTGALDGNLAANRTLINHVVNVTVPIGATIYLRWTDLKTSGSNDGLSIDDLSISFGTTVAVKPLLVSTVPVDNSTNVAFGTNQNLTVTFDKNITLGTGNVYVADLTALSTQTIAATACTVSGMTVTIPGVNLNANSNYAVKFDSTAFKYLTNNSNGIYDSTTWNFKTINPKPLITTKTPTGSGVALNTNLVMTFDKNITAGTGNIYLVNLATNAVTQTIPVASATIASNVATVSGITTAYATSYAVKYDSTCFTAGGYNSIGSYDTTFWKFTTVSAPLPAQTSLNETFTGCLAPAYDLFTAYSVAGSAVWKCSKYGHNDSSAAYVNGGTAQSNEDWLISPKLNFSAMSTPYFNFWNKVRYVKSATKQVMISHDYAGTGSPALATWVNTGITISNDSVWTAYNNFSLTSHKATDFFIAFKYTSDTTTADEWNVDDITVSASPLSINNITNENLNAFVTNNQLHIIAKEASTFTLTITDITGKVLSTKTINVLAGSNQFAIENTNTATGLYLLNLHNNQFNGSIKFVQ